MNRSFLPVLLDITDLRILFVGAGEGTRVKLVALVKQNPTVRIVAPLLSHEVAVLASKLSDVQIFERPFVEADLDDVSLVYGFTDDQALNSRLAELCRNRGLWSNIAGNRSGGSFHSPAVARKDGVVAAFSSESGHPAVAVASRDAWLGVKK